jgi:pimeloyl-ACP methyl ester carboxylesterase
MIRPFFVNTPQQILDDLKLRISNTRWPDEIHDSGWNFGSNLSFVKQLSDYWLNDFDWRKVEAEINTYPGFIAAIDGYDIHFLHIKGKGSNSIPLIITHGWPGSFLEMLKLIPLLTEDNNLSFDLVIPSIPGFGFSSSSNVAGCNAALVADLWHKLMTTLGYNKYAAQGGDIGAGVSTWLPLKYPDSVIGLHLNFIPGSFKPYLKDGEQLSDEVVAYQTFLSNWMAKEGAYSHLHATKPITLAYGLNDSPVGLCAWVIEKFNSWSDNHGDVNNVFTNDELLANITLYWITQSIHSSIRIYNENSQSPLALKEHDFVKVPTAFAKFPRELPTPPQSYIEKGFNIQRWTEMPAGGHFAAMEQPVLLGRDIQDFFAALL